MFRTVTAISLSTLLFTSACSSDDAVKSAPSKRPANSVGQQNRPFYVSDQAWAASKPLSSLKKIGDTAFSTTNVSETSDEPEVIVRKDESGKLCLSAMTRLWTSPGIDIANHKTGIINTIVNVAITKTESGYTLSAASNPVDDHVFGSTEHCANPLKIDTSATARAMVGDPDSFRNGQSGYIPAGCVWTDKAGKTAYLLTDASSPRPFAGFVRVTKQDGKLTVTRIAGSGSYEIVDSSQMAVEEKTKVTSATIS